MAYIDPSLVVSTPRSNEVYFEPLHEIYKVGNEGWTSSSSGFDGMRLDYTGLNLYDEPPKLDRRDSGYSPQWKAQESNDQEIKDQVRRDKRKEQNRLAQRLYRERKEQRITELEEKISVLIESVSNLQGENGELEVQICRIRTENDVIRSSMSAKSSPAAAPHEAAVRPEPKIEQGKGILLRDTLTIHGGWYGPSG